MSGSSCRIWSDSCWLVNEVTTSLLLTPDLLAPPSLPTSRRPSHSVWLTWELPASKTWWRLHQDWRSRTAVFGSFAVFTQPAVLTIRLETPSAIPASCEDLSYARSITVGGDGATHQSLEDIGMMRPIDARACSCNYYSARRLSGLLPARRPLLRAYGSS